jgi:hypothetical protein
MDENGLHPPGYSLKLARLETTPNPLVQTSSHPEFLSKCDLCMRRVELSFWVAQVGFGHERSHVLRYLLFSYTQKRHRPFVSSPSSPSQDAMLPASLLLFCLTALEARAQTTTNDFYSTTFTTLSDFPSSTFGGDEYTYLSYTGQSTVESTTTNGTDTASATDSQSRRTSTSQELTLIGGPTRTNGTSIASSTSTGPAATNTVPCNGWPEFCNRKYSNISNICAHNSAFSIANNAGSNQLLPILDQLNDGVRMRKYTL